MKIKVGMKVVCVENPNGIVNSDHGGKGAGWKLGYVFTVSNITGNSPKRILWKGYNGCGVYEDFVKPAEWRLRWDLK